MKNIDYFRKMTEETAKAIKWPFQKKRIARAYESVIDSAELLEEEVGAQIVDLKRELTTAESDEAAREVIKKIIDLRNDLEMAKQVSEFAKSEKIYDFDTDAVIEEEGKK